ncbi:outer membrane protein transport protein [Bosea sp. Root381]|uniref:OmpP1/FadL family transporter n=1 Tax=Bosea sp. Root381 TaxID=1736524 RepID=UPI000A7B0940|nr:outer membrane protein transport protein [Bosea sp. Root381]
MKRFVRTAAVATVSVAALLAAGAASASSFAIRSGQSAEGLGMAYAGAASGGIGMGSMAWNPATITMFPGRNSNWNFTYLYANGDYQPTRPTTVGGVPIQALGGSPLGTGNIGGDGAFIPASYSNWQLTDRFWIGLTTGAPFGLRSKPENQFYGGQIYGRSAKLGSYNVSPTIGYKVNDWLSVGAAFQIQYLKTTLKTATGASIFQAVGPSAPSQILKGDSIDYGFRVGATLTPWQGTTIGLAYRSSIRQTLDGTISTVAGVTPIKANLNLPDSVVVGLSQVINDQWQAHLGVEWTNWSRFRRIPIVNENTGTPFPGLPSLNFEYDDSWYFSAGLEYKYNRDLTLRAGVAYELSAVNDTNRTVFISDNDRLWLSAGASYQVMEKLKLDVGYTYIHVNKATVNYGGTHPQQGPVIFAAEAKPYIHIVSAGLTYRWDNPAETIPVQPVVRKF